VTTTPSTTKVSTTSTTKVSTTSTTADMPATTTLGVNEGRKESDEKSELR
jgi:hypothetical protein